MPTPKYHLYLEYAEAEKGGFRFNITQEELQRTFADPYNEGKQIWHLGRLLNPIKVKKVVIFWSYDEANQLDMPNYESIVAAKDKKLVAEAIEKGKVKGAYVCTDKFLAKHQAAAAPTGVSASAKRRVLVISGSDDAMKQALTKALTKLLLVPVVLCEEPGHGRKIVERFSADYADVGLAVVLLSPDDYVFAKTEQSTKRKLKPRQDVVFELGYLLGKLGKDRVLAFYREADNFEGRIDFEGITTSPFDALGSWKLALLHGLADNGYTVEGDRILK
jgi:Predicted nucleotide-binding protein containing TIR -like domain